MLEVADTDSERDSVSRRPGRDVTPTHGAPTGTFQSPLKKSSTLVTDEIKRIDVNLSVLSLLDWIAFYSMVDSEEAKVKSA